MPSSHIWQWNGWCVLLALPHPSAACLDIWSCLISAPLCPFTLKPVYVHSSEKSACCEFYLLTPPPLPPESVEGTGYLCELVVSILRSVHLYPHVRSPNRCMCSIVVVTAMVWSFLCIQVIFQTFFWYFMYFLIWLGRFQDPQQCQSPLLYNFFFEKQTNIQKNHRDVFFLYVTTYETYTVLKQSSNYSSIFCPECVGLRMRTGLDNLTLF